MSKIEEAITEYYGPRCPDVYPGCPCCDAWAEYDALSSDMGNPITERPYHYIGKDGKTVLARVLEDERDELRAKLALRDGECEAKALIISRLENDLDEARRVQAKDFQLLDSPWKKRAEAAEAALHRAEEDFYTAINRFNDEDYAGPIDALNVTAVCYAKPYFETHMQHLAESAARVLAALEGRKVCANGFPCPEGPHGVCCGDVLEQGE